MTGYESKKAAAQAKTIDEVNWADHEPNVLAQSAQRAWVGLTDKEIKALAAPFDDYEIPMTGRMWVFVGDIEAKLKEKNT